MGNQKYRRLATGWVALVLFALAFATPALAATWAPTVAYETKLSQDRTIQTTHVMFPILGDEDSLLFGDIHSVTTRGYSWEVNFGIGYRWLMPDGESLLGTYAFYDRRHILPTDSVWQQITLGVERITRNTSMRFNVYLPRQEHLLVSSTITDAIVIRGNNLIYQEASTNVYETALRGFDVGFTHRVQGPLNLHVSGTAFHFFAPDVPNVTGARLRVENVVEDIFRIPGSSFTLGFDAQYDTLRGSETFVGLGVRIPLGGSGTRADGAADSDLLERMMDPVERDIDIVTASTVPIREVENESTPVNAETGEELGVIWFIEEGASDTGAGTQDDPISIAGLLGSDRFGENQVIVAQGENAIQLGEQSLTLLPGQVLLSGGGSILLQSPNCRTLEFRVDGNPTTLTTENDIPLVTVSGNNTIRSIRLKGGAYGIYGTDVFGNVEISDVEITDTIWTGIDLDASEGTSFHVRIEDSQIDVSGPFGVLISATSVGQTTVEMIRNQISALSFGVTVTVLSGENAEVLFADNRITTVAEDAIVSSGGQIILFTSGTSSIDAHGNFVEVENQGGSDGIGLLLYAIGTDARISATENDIITKGAVSQALFVEAGDSAGLAGTALVEVHQNRIESEQRGIQVNVFNQLNSAVSIHGNDVVSGNSGITMNIASLGNTTVDVHHNTVRAGLAAIAALIGTVDGNASVHITNNDLEANDNGMLVEVTAGRESSVVVEDNHLQLSPSLAANTAGAGIYVRSAGLLNATIQVHRNEVTVESDDESEGVVSGILLLGVGGQSSEIHAADNVVEGDKHTDGLFASAITTGEYGDDEPTASVLLERNQITTGGIGLHAEAASPGGTTLEIHDNVVDAANVNTFLLISSGNASLSMSGNQLISSVNQIAIGAPVDSTLQSATVNIADNELRGQAVGLVLQLHDVGDAAIDIVRNAISSTHTGLLLRTRSNGDVSLRLTENNIASAGPVAADMVVAAEGAVDIAIEENQIRATNGSGLVLVAQGNQELLVTVSDNNVTVDQHGLLLLLYSENMAGIHVFDNTIDALGFGLGIEIATAPQSAGSDDSNSNDGEELGPGELSDAPLSFALIEGNDITAAVGIDVLVASAGIAHLTIIENEVDALIGGIGGVAVGDVLGNAEIVNNTVLNAEQGIFGGAGSLNEARLVIGGNVVHASELGIRGDLYGGNSALGWLEGNEVTASTGILLTSYHTEPELLTEGQTTLVLVSNLVNAESLGIGAFGLGRGDVHIFAEGNVVSGAELGIGVGAVSVGGNASVNVGWNTVYSNRLGVLAFAGAYADASATVTDNQVTSECLGIIAASLSYQGTATTTVADNEILGCNTLIAAAVSLLGDAQLTIRSNQVDSLGTGILGLALAGGDAVAVVEENNVISEAIGIGVIGLARGDTSILISENEVSGASLGIGAVGLSVGSTEISILNNTVVAQSVGIGAFAGGLGGASLSIAGNSVVGNLGVLARTLSLLGIDNQLSFTGNSVIYGETAWDLDAWSKSGTPTISEDDNSAEPARG